MRAAFAAPWAPLRAAHAALPVCRVWMAARGPGKGAGKGFGQRPAQPPRVPKESDGVEILPPLDRRPFVEEEYVPRGPTMKDDFQGRGLMEKELGPDAGVLPAIVADRMLRRILTFGGIPLGFLFAFFGAYFVLTYKYDVTVIPVVVAYSTLGTIGMATLGITYGIFSSSWDEDVEGSRLGWAEAKKNLVRAKDGLTGQRQKEKEGEEFAKIDALNRVRANEIEDKDMTE